MMSAILPETETPNKTLDHSNGRGSIVIQISLTGINSIRIVATHSNESDRLSERLAVVRPLIDLLEQTFMDERPMIYAGEGRHS